MVLKISSMWSLMTLLSFETVEKLIYIYNQFNGFEIVFKSKKRLKLLQTTEKHLKSQLFE